MARKALSMSLVKEIQRYRDLGLTERGIARALKVHRKTVRKYLSRSVEPVGLSAPATQATKPWLEKVDWPSLFLEAQKGVPIQVLWEELKEEGKLNIGYSGFWKQFKRRYPVLKKSMHRVFEPGVRAEIDYCDGIDLLDVVTGEVRSTQFFVGVLCQSRYTYAEFTWSQKSEDFLSSHINMISYFGGVPQVMSPDNLKSAVTKAHKYDPEINPAYARLAQHYNFAVVPARVRRPKDKAIVERTIQIFQRWFFYRIRHRTFTSLKELNDCTREHLEIFHAKKHRVLQRTRAEMFTEERTHLQRLPESPYVVSTHKMAKVHEDCHFVFEKNYYSVPHQYRGQKIDIWVTAKTVEGYSEGQQISIHSRASGVGRFKTKKEHYPPGHQAYSEQTPQYLLEEAEKIGPQTREFVKALLLEAHPLRHIRRLQGVLRLSKSYSPEKMENASEVANHFGNRSYKFFERLLKSNAQRALQENKQIERGSNPHLRGTELFH